MKKGNVKLLLDVEKIPTITILFLKISHKESKQQECETFSEILNCSEI
jgi:hypothetical protein